MFCRLELSLWKRVSEANLKLPSKFFWVNFGYWERFLSAAILSTLHGGCLSDEDVAFFFFWTRGIGMQRQRFAPGFLHDFLNHVSIRRGFCLGADMVFTHHGFDVNFYVMWCCQLWSFLFLYPHQHHCDNKYWTVLFCSKDQEAAWKKQRCPRRVFHFMVAGSVLFFILYLPAY